MITGSDWHKIMNFNFLPKGFKFSLDSIVELVTLDIHWGLADGIENLQLSCGGMPQPFVGFIATSTGTT
jgi:hypothetical protein